MADYVSPQSRSSTFVGDLQQRISNLGLSRSATIGPIRENRDPSGIHTVVPIQDAFVEIVFVHGLRGHQTLSWTYDADDAATFWPSWLNDEPGFSHVRVHNFGYNAESTDRRVLVSKLDDFGILLCETLSINSYLKRDVHNPIIFVAHSLGGLVVKAAVNHAKRNADFAELCRRFHSIFFLATPHRGADNMAMLTKILGAATPPSQQPSGPDPSASVIERINLDFRYHRQGIRLWSFYESLPFFHHSNDLIVGKASAVLDVPEEHRLMIPANHISASKYSSTSDPSYILVRDTLRDTIVSIDEELRNPEKINDQLRSIATYLDCSEFGQEELVSKIQEKVEGTCQWLLEHQDFLTWRDATRAIDTGLGIQRSPGSPSSRYSRQIADQALGVFWLTGPPGSGKSFLAAHIISHLQETRDCSFYFLKNANQSKQDLSGLLKSLALQMARQHRVLRHWLLSLAQDDALAVGSSDFRAIWKQLFVQKIFQTDLSQRQYWVIDAIDEGKSGNDLVGLLAQIPKHLPYSIFLTSRKNLRLEQAMHMQRILPTIHAIGLESSLEDIRTYLEAHVNLLPVTEAVELQDLISQLVRKSRGSFLWISLVLRKLSDSWTKKNRELVLRSVPDGMNRLYLDILADMARNNPLDLPKAMLRWTVCSVAPLTVVQFQEAIQLDIQDEVTRIEEAITRTCGQLVTVELGHVHLVHNTVREFLLGLRPDHEFAISEPEIHQRIATICLEYLTVGSRNARFRGPQRHRSASDTSPGSFYEYASKNFSEHIVNSMPNRTDSPLSELLQFLQTSTLSWIEHCARSKDLTLLTLAGKNLKSYVQKMTDFQASLSDDTILIHEWSNDLIHLVTAFGQFLIDEPTSIYSVIPAICPKKSRMYQVFGSAARGLEVVGRHGRIWSDLLSSTHFAPDYAQVLACCERYFAVGTRSGRLVVFSSSTCQEKWSTNIGEPVKNLDFAQSSVHSWIVISTKSKIVMMDYETKCPVWDKLTQSEVVTLRFSTPALDAETLRLTALTRNGHLEIYDPMSGECEIHRSLYGDGVNVPQRRPPRQAYISDELGSLALVWRNEPLEMYSVDDDVTRARYVEFPSSVEALAFNPTLNMIAVATFDGQLSITGLWNLQQIKSVSIAASHLATSADGQTLLAGTNSGAIKLIDFESLSVLHTISFSDHEIISLMFAGNGLRFLDIRRQSVNVWESSALVRRKDTDVRSLSSGVSDLQTYSTAPSERVQSYLAPTVQSLISNMVSDGSSRFIFCGKQDGQVMVYDVLRSKNHLQRLFTHGRSTVVCLDWNDGEHLITSCDNANRILIHQVKLIAEHSPTGTRDRWHVRKILDQHLETPEPVRQVVCGVPPQYILISTTRSDYLWKLDGTYITHQSHTSLRHQETRWIAHPTRKRRLIGLRTEQAHSIRWSRTSSEVPFFEEVQFDVLGTLKAQVIMNNIHIAAFEGGTFMMHERNSHKAPLIWTLSSNSSHSADLLERIRTAAPMIKMVGGIFGSQLVFLGTDGWFRTLRLDENFTERDLLKRRFPLPHCWQATNERQQPQFLVTRIGDVVIASGDEVVVVQRGLTSGGL